MYIYNKPQTNKDHWPQIYIVTIECDGQCYVKVGKTNDAASRFNKYSNGLANASITFETVYDFPNSDVWCTDKYHESIEQEIHKRLKQTGNRITPHFMFDGYTECYDLPVSYVKRITEEVIIEKIDAKAPREWIHEAINNCYYGA